MMAHPNVVIVGAGGRLGAALHREYARELTVSGFNHAQLDLAASDQVRATLEPLDFDLLINCAAQTNVDRCETHPEEAFQLNAEAPRLLAEICAAKGAKLVHISTDYVFDGEQARPYSENDAANPISVYGASKRQGEEFVLAAAAQHLVVRVSWVFGPDRPSFIDWVIGQARAHEQVQAVADKFSTPTYTADLAQWLRPVIANPAATGVLHLANSGGCSWQEYGQWALDCCHAAGVRLRTREVGATTLDAMRNFIARRPVHTTLATTRFQQLTGMAPRSWREAVADYVQQHVAPAAV